MKKCVMIFVCLLCIMFSHAQSKDFEQVYKACLLVQSSMSDGEGSYMEIDRAIELLNISNWSSLRLHNLDGKDEVKYEKENIIFSPEYLMKYSQRKNLFIRKAKKYASKI